MLVVIIKNVRNKDINLRVTCLCIVVKATGVDELLRLEVKKAVKARTHGCLGGVTEG